MAEDMLARVLQIPLIYYEDDSFQKIRTEQGKVCARQWRFALERLTGRYNARVEHVCGPACVAGDDDDDDEYDPTRGRQLIDQRLGLHGCAESGIIHQCGQTRAERQQTCRVVVQSTTGQVLCRFSGWVVDEVYEDAYVYNPYVDDHYEFRAPIRACNKPARSARRAREIHDEKTRRARDDADLRRGRFSGESIRATAQALQSLALRSPKRSRSNNNDDDDDDDDDGGDPDESESGSERPAKRATPPPSPPPPPLLGPKAASAVALSDHYRVSDSVLARVKTTVREILFDPNVHRDFCEHADASEADAMPLPVGAVTYGKVEDTEERDKLEADKQRLLFYARRIALIYAVVKEQKDRASPGQSTTIRVRRNPRATIRRTRRAKRGAARAASLTPAARYGASFDVKKFAVASLYLLSTGLAMGEHSVLPPDPNLARCMPSTDRLQWYGFDSDVRCAYLRRQQTPQARRVSYRFDRNLYQEIQCLISTFARGPEFLRRLLSGDVS